MTAQFKTKELSVRERLNALDCLPAQVAQNAQDLLPLQAYTGKNLLINGDFSVWQRSESFTDADGNSGLCADRFNYHMGTGGTGTISRVALSDVDRELLSNSLYCLNFNVASGTSSSSRISQNVEDVRSLAGKTLTCSFYAKTANPALKPKFSIYQTFGSGGSAGVSYTVREEISLSPEWAKYSFTFKMPSVVGKTVGTDSYTYIHLLNYGNYLSTDVEFSIANVQLELGSEATEFEIVDPATQLARCLRYYQEVKAINIAGSARHYPVEPLNFVALGAVLFPVPMRVAPAITYKEPLTATNISSLQTSTSNIAIALNGNFDGVQHQAITGGLIALSAEL